VHSDEVIRTLVRHDYGRWSHAEIDPLIDQLGRDSDELMSTRSSLTFGEATRVEFMASDDRSAGVDFDVVQAVFAVPEENQLAAVRGAIAVAAEVLGPPPLVGGSGAMVRWFSPDTRVQLEPAGPRKFLLTLVPRRHAEAELEWRSEWQDFEPPDDWWLEPDRTAATDDVRFYAVEPTPNWTTFARRLRGVFRSLIVDQPMLVPYLPTIVWRITRADRDDDLPLLQGWFAAGEAHVEVGEAGLTESRARNGLPGMTVPAGTADDAKNLITFVLDVLRRGSGGDPRALRYHAWPAAAGGREPRLREFDLRVAHDSVSDPVFADPIPL
jgi:hypothetical protein